MAQGFQHTPLTLHQGIRVLDLLPSCKRNAPLECKTREIALGDPIELYEAISYVWGERVGTYPISCNGQEMLVTPNCRDALLQLRSSYRTRTLWIDAICIDQSDAGTLERNEQIKYMGHIYHKASCVIVWLGSADKLTIQFFRLSRVITHIPLRIQWKLRHRLRVCLRNKMDESITRLLSHPWFSRAWTIQEFAASRRCILMCGGSSLSWEGFAQLDEKYYYSYTNIHSHRALLNVRISVFDLIREYDLSLDPDHIPQARSWDDLSYIAKKTDFSLINSISSFESSLPHDKIYAIYSIIRASGIHIPPPDYGKSIAQVFEDVSTSYIRDRKKLHILMAMLPSPDTDTFPSWVPDWQTHIVKPPFETEMNGMFGGIDRWNSYSASGSSRHTFVDSSSPGSLVVRAKHLGRLTSRRAALPMDSQNFMDFGKFRNFNYVCQHWCREVAALPSYPTGEDPRYAAYMTFTPISITSNFSEDFILWFDAMLYPDCSWVSKELLDAEFNKGGTNMTDIIEFICSRNWQSTRTMLRITYGAQGDINMAANYALFFLDNGYIVMAYHTCQEDDQVYLLAGSDWPFILRPKGDAFRIVAPAFIHGVMKGELWPEDESELDQITLV